MKLQAITHDDIVEWRGSKLEAKKRTAEIKKEYKANLDAVPEITIKEIEVPTDKIGLLEFLNVHANRDDE